MIDHYALWVPLIFCQEFRMVLELDWDGAPQAQACRGDRSEYDTMLPNNLPVTGSLVSTLPKYCEVLTLSFVCLPFWPRRGRAPSAG